MKLEVRHIVRRVVRTLRKCDCLLMGKVVTLYLQLHGAEVGSALNVRSLPFCRKQDGAVIRVGNGVSIYNRMRENFAGVAHRTALIAAMPGARLLIGDHVGISGAVLYCTTEIIIEDYVNIGAGVRIYDTDFHPLDSLARRRHDNSQIKSAPVKICEDAFIGANAFVLKGVIVGARTIVGAGAVVTKSLPPDVVAAGNPARIIADFGSQRMKQSPQP